MHNTSFAWLPPCRSCSMHCGPHPLQPSSALQDVELESHDHHQLHADALAPAPASHSFGHDDAEGNETVDRHLPELEQLFQALAHLISSGLFDVPEQYMPGRCASSGALDVSLPVPVLSAAISSTESMGICPLPSALTVLAGITPAAVCPARRPPAYLRLASKDWAQQAASPVACLLTTALFALLCVTGKQQAAIARVLNKCAMRRTRCAAIRVPCGIRRRRRSSGAGCRSMWFALVRFVWAFFVGFS
jgi:hypothetical protein